jgi:hypothetical protein
VPHRRWIVRAYVLEVCIGPGTWRVWGETELGQPYQFYALEIYGRALTRALDHNLDVCKLNKAGTFGLIVE